MQPRYYTKKILWNARYSIPKGVEVSLYKMYTVHKDDIKTVDVEWGSYYIKYVNPDKIEIVNS